MMFKFALLAVAITAVTASSVLPPAPADGKCTPRKAYALDCNICICNDEGFLAACTQKGCVHFDRNVRTLSTAELPEFPGDGKCTPGAAYKLRNCNTCVCLENGAGICTLEDCLN